MVRASSQLGARQGSYAVLHAGPAFFQMHTVATCLILWLYLLESGGWCASPPGVHLQWKPAAIASAQPEVIEARLLKSARLNSLML